MIDNNVVSLVKELVAYVIAIILVIINVISLKWYKKKEDAQSEQIELLNTRLRRTSDTLGTLCAIRLRGKQKMVKVE